MNSVTSREVIHNFSAVVARVAAGEELTVTHYGKPVLKLVQFLQAELSQSDRLTLLQKALSFRMVTPYGQKFDRADAYDAFGR